MNNSVNGGPEVTSDTICSDTSKEKYHQNSQRFIVPLVISFLLVISSGIRIIRDPAAIHPDCALNLQLGKMILDGKVPYVDFIEINPPLIMYLNTFPAFLAKVFDPPIIFVFQMLVFFLMIWSILECWLFTRSLKVNGLNNRVMLMMAMASVMVLIKGEFGQREHLFMLVYLPYVLLRLNREEDIPHGLPHSVLVGILAGVGLCLKPHFLLIAFFIEMIALARHRSIRILFQPESMSILGFVIIYVMHWFFVPAEMREEFFGRWVPFITERYSAYDARSFSGLWIPWVQSYWPVDTHASRGLRIILSLIIRGFQTGVLFWGLILLFRGITPVPRHITSFLFLMLSCLILFWSQRKGFSYHLIPLDFAFFGLVSFVCIPVAGPYNGILSFKRVNSFVSILVSSLGILLSISAATGIPGGFHGIAGETRSLEEQNFHAFLKQHTQQDDRVVVISTGVSPAYPTLLQLGLKPGSRYIWTFPIALIYEPMKSSVKSLPMYHTVEEQTPEESLMLSELEEDIRLNKPKVIAVKNSPRNSALPDGFNLLEYLRFNGWIDRALVNYQPIDSPESWQMFLGMVQ